MLFSDVTPINLIKKSKGINLIKVSKGITINKFLFFKKFTCVLNKL